jgi:tetratricopeptide (TPR) repeat protein
MSSGRCVALAAALSISLASAGVLAQQKRADAAAAPSSEDEVARGLFQAGKAAYEASNYTDALNFFEQAYARSGRPQLLYNVGQSADRLRQDQKALDAFKKYLELVPDASNRVEVETRIGVLERTIAERNHSAPVAAVPTPSETAAQAQPAPHEAPTSDVAFDEPDEAGGEPVTKKGWFWTGVGAVVLGGTAVALAVALGGEEAGQEPLYEGNGGSLRGP